MLYINNTMMTASPIFNIFHTFLSTCLDADFYSSYYHNLNLENFDSSFSVFRS